jgi:glycosyltransferase involved in cell wall biosynthesis
MLRARLVIRKIKPDIVHGHFATSAGLAALVCGVRPYLVTAHGSDVTLGLESTIWRLILRFIFNHSDCVNVVSDGLRDMVLGLGIPQAKVETLTLGIDTNRFVFQPPRQKTLLTPIRLICTRRLEEVYNHLTIVRAMAILAKRHIVFKLTLVGDGPFRAQLQDQALELGIENRVTFAGTVPNQHLPELFADHDIYLSASLRDGTSLSLLEAMASGLYPIVSDIRANSDWIQHGQNGRLHRVSDPENLADCIQDHLRDAGTSGETLAFNRDLVVRRGDRATNMKQLEGVYYKLKSKTRPHGLRSTRTQ